MAGPSGRHASDLRRLQRVWAIESTDATDGLHWSLFSKKSSLSRRGGKDALGQQEASVVGIRADFFAVGKGGVYDVRVEKEH